MGLGFSHRAGWCRPEKARFSSPVDGSFRDVERPLDRGWDPISSRGGAGSTCEPWPIRKSAGGVGISTPCGEVSCVDGFRSRPVTLSCPGDAYFVYESCPMRDQTKLTCLYFRQIKLESEILSCQNRKRCRRVLYLQKVNDINS